MRAPLTWLRDYAPLDADVERLTEVLSELGLVVDGVEVVGEGLGDVVVARVLDIRPHPDADRIRLVDVDHGARSRLQIVCGAWNFAVGDLVPLAPVGAVLPGGSVISKRKMRGEVSHGMLCSASELGLPGPDGAAGLLILEPGLAAPGTPLVDALGLHPDVVFDLDITPNRPDALCMAGVARDLAAALGEEWHWPAGAAPTAGLEVDPDLGRAPIVVEAGELCPRFAGTILEGVPDGPSPRWLARRLTLAGMRPINAVVDASNYVMLDLGQPNHAYDLEQLGGGGILVRRGRPGETLVTLDGEERRLEDADCVISDARGTPVGVGGIMGGSTAEIGPATKRVLLECAWFEPRAIARTGNRLALHSEARTRFERGVDPGVADRAVERFCDLLRSVPGGERLRRGPTVDVRDPHLPTGPVIGLRTARVNDVLGVALDEAAVAGLLGPLGFSLHPRPGGFEVAVPSWRLEVSREIDLIEEVARMWGYRRIERTVPAGAGKRTGGLTPRQRERRRVRQTLAGAGLDEAWTTTFLGPGDLERAGLETAAVEVQNPLDRSESLLRTSLLPGLLKTLRFNTDHQLEDLALFEIGRVFALPAGGALVPDEAEHLAAVFMPPPGSTSTASIAAVASAVRAWQWLASTLRLEGPTLEAASVPGLHPGRSARLLAEGLVLGEVGEVDPAVVAAYDLPGRVGWLQLSLDLIAEAPRRPGRALDVSRYPASDVDLAFVVPDEIPAAQLLAAVRSAGGEMLEDVSLFDVYRGERLGTGRRSLAVRARFRALDRTLSDSDLASLRQALIVAATVLGGELRA